MRDWVDWHLAYDDPSSALSGRLACVRRHLRQAVDDAPAGPVSLVSLCAGQGHDVLGVLPGHRRRDDVRAVLVESDSVNAGLASRRAVEAGLSQVQVRQADASLVATFADALPADVLMLCGIFGNISDTEIERMVKLTAGLCAPGATVIWTRHRRPPDLTASIRGWFADSGFGEVAFDALDTGPMVGVGVSRLRHPDQVGHASLPQGSLFSFRAG